MCNLVFDSMSAGLGVHVGVHMGVHVGVHMGVHVGVHVGVPTYASTDRHLMQNRSWPRPGICC